ncbi:hypothetical protein MRB53_021786 [Persea americana]|uniref:Uncharacterized protein n=1 Tax=Persea americana TaxID=3435 RepID=A0ACC2L4U9_PERAE|nr:hypothetical protein MRB53_021786 [Persea americana]
MKAVLITSPGGPEVLQVQEVENPRIGDDEVLIKIGATALNRADTLQRKGSYPPPEGASPGRYRERDRIRRRRARALTRASNAPAPSNPSGRTSPDGRSELRSCKFLEVACTVWSTAFLMSQLSAGETFLIHGGSSGIGTFSIQIAKHQGARVFVTAGSQEKLTFCKELGADVCINYKIEDFVARVKEETGGKGVNVILDNVGGLYFQRNLNSLNVNGFLSSASRVAQLQRQTSDVCLQGTLLCKLRVCELEALKTKH